MVTVERLKMLSAAFTAGVKSDVDEALRSLGSPDEKTLVKEALSLLDSADRNLRVLGLRILFRFPLEGAHVGILRGLTDVQRRVRKVAAQCSQPFLDKQVITDQLRSMIDDPNEKRKISQQAFTALSTPGEKLEFGRLPDTAVSAMEALAKGERHRMPVLLGLLQMELSDEVESLLAKFVKEGTREEAVLATRGLCGFRVVNIGRVSDPTLKSRIESECDIAAGRVFYWVARRQPTANSTVVL